MNLAQREAVIKQLKKELTTAKASLTKVKAKNKELKLQFTSSIGPNNNASISDKENVSHNYSNASTKHSSSRKHLLFCGKPSSNNSRYCLGTENDLEIDRSVIRVAQMLIQ